MSALSVNLERWTSGRKSLSITFNDVIEGFTLLLSNYFQSLKNLTCFCKHSVKNFKQAKLFGSYSDKGASINYIDKKGVAKCQQYYISLCSKLVNEGRGDQKYSKAT